MIYLCPKENNEIRFLFAHDYELFLNDNIDDYSIREYKIECDYGNYDRLLRLISDSGGMVQNTDFTDKITINVMFKEVDSNAFLDKLCENFASKLTAKQENKIFFPFNL